MNFNCVFSKVLDRSGFHAVFHNRTLYSSKPVRKLEDARIEPMTRKSMGQAASLELREFLFAPVLLHAPVDSLHSTEFKAHTVLFFPLTAEKEGVKP